jgi:hypothetical protein
VTLDRPDGSHLLRVLSEAFGQPVQVSSVERLAPYMR